MSSDELIQIVDTNDRIVGSAPMREAWSKGLIHRVSRVMLEDGKGSVLLAKRSAAKEAFPNCWGNSAAGHVDAGESYEQTAQRELAEELGITDLGLQEMGYFFADTTYKDIKMKRFVKVYRGVTNVTPKNLQTNEVAEVKWFSIPEVKELIKAQPDKVEDGIVQVFERFYQ